MRISSYDWNSKCFKIQTIVTISIPNHTPTTLDDALYTLATTHLCSQSESTSIAAEASIYWTNVTTGTHVGNDSWKLNAKANKGNRNYYYR